MRNPSLGLLVLLVVPFFFCRTITGQQNAGIGQTAVLACQANLDSFKYYKCRYVVTKANAESVTKALKGEYFNVRKYENIVVVDGDHAKTEYVGEAIKP